MSTQEASPDLVGQIEDRLRELSEFYVEVIAAAEATVAHAEAEQQRYQAEGSDIADLYAATATAMRLITKQLTTSMAATAQLMLDAPKIRGLGSDEEAVADATKLLGAVQHHFDLRNQAQQTLWDARGRITSAIGRPSPEFEPIDDALLRLGNVITDAKDPIGAFVTLVKKGPAD